MSDHHVPLGRVTIRNEKEDQLAFLENGLIVGSHVTGTDEPVGSRSRWDIGPQDGYYTIVNDYGGLYVFNRNPSKPNDPVVANPMPTLYDIKRIHGTEDHFTIATTEDDPLYWALDHKNGDVKLAEKHSKGTTWIIKKN